jgi:hypothetical protein
VFALAGAGVTPVGAFVAGAAGVAGLAHPETNKTNAITTAAAAEAVHFEETILCSPPLHQAAASSGNLAIIRWGRREVALPGEPFDAAPQR